VLDLISCRLRLRHCQLCANIRRFGAWVERIQQGKFQSAAALFARAEEAAPARPMPCCYESKAYIHLEQFTAAEGALPVSTQDACRCQWEALYLLGYVLHREGKAAESLET